MKPSKIILQHQLKAPAGYSPRGLLIPPFTLFFPTPFESFPTSAGKYILAAFERRSGVLAAFEREIVLREPTIAHDLWIEQAMRFVPMDNRNLNFLYGYALSREAGKLVDAYNPKKLIRTVFKFAAKRLAFYTDDQLSAAVDYCLFGADWTAGARGPDREQGSGNRLIPNT